MLLFWNNQFLLICYGTSLKTNELLIVFISRSSVGHRKTLPWSPKRIKLLHFLLWFYGSIKCPINSLCFKDNNFYVLLLRSIETFWYMVKCIKLQSIFKIQFVDFLIIETVFVQIRRYWGWMCAYIDVTNFAEYHSYRIKELDS